MIPKLVPFQAEHLFSLRNRDGGPIDTVESALEKEKGGPAYSAITDRVLGCSGIIFMWPGVAQAWATFSDDLAKHHAIWMTKQVRSKLRELILAHDLFRVEMTVLASDKRNQEWARFLGFSCEGGVARDYLGLGVDAYRYEWLRFNITTRVLQADDALQFMTLVRDHGNQWHDKPFGWFLEEVVTVVALEFNKIVGYVIYEVINEDCALGRNMVVHKDYRGRGVADKMHAARLKIAKTRGLRWFMGMAENGNPATAKILSRYGAIKVNTTQEGDVYLGQLT